MIVLASLFGVIVLLLTLGTAYGARLQRRGNAPLDPSAVEVAGQRIASTRTQRRVAYLVYGSDDPSAPVVLNVHGSGLECGFEATVYADACAALGVRGIAISLPGCGFTDPKPGRVVKDWPHEDLQAVLDAEGVDTFHITGHSQGTPHAMAAALAFPDRCVGLGLNAPLLPSALVKELGLPKTIGEGQTPSSAALAQGYMAPYFGMMGLLLAVIPPQVVASAVTKGLPKLAADHATKARFYASIAASSVRGIAGGVWETAQDTCFDWGLDIRALQHPNAAVWHADDDNAIPAAQGRWLAEHLGAHYRHESEGYGHMTYARGRYLTAEHSLVRQLLEGAS